MLTREFRLERITDPTGRQVTLSYHATTGHLTEIADWTGRKWTYAHDVWGNLTSVTAPATAAHPKGAKTTYEYSDSRFPHRITAVIPPNGQPATEGGAAVPRITNTYDAEGRVVEQRFSNGSVTKIAYNETDTTVTDPSGTQWIYTTSGRQITSRTIVTRGVRAAEKEASGTRYTTRYEYNSEKQGSRTVFPGGHAIEQVYDIANANVLARGNLLTLRRVPVPGSTDPVLETRYTYKTPYQQVGTITDPRGNKTEFFYDATTHNLTHIELPAATQTGGGTPAPTPTPPSGQADGNAAPAPPRPTIRFQIDAHGQLTQWTDPNGNATRFQYDANGYLVKATRAHGTLVAAATTFTRDALGRATAILDARGHSTAIQYNTWDLVTKITAPSPLGYVTDFHYDASRNLLRVERQSGDAADPQTTTYTYNQRDWLLSTANELGETTRLAYDANGNLRTATDPAGRVTTWTYDERNLLYEVRDALGQTTRLFYHPSRRLSEVVDPKNQSTRYAYDRYQRLITTTHADASTEQRAYDRADNLVRWTTRAGQVLTFTYDSQNRRISKVTAAGTTRYGYDLGSRLVRVASPGATLTFAYNARDQLVTETTQPAGRTTAWTVSRVYDGEDNATQLTYPDGSAFHHAFDALNRRTAVQNAAKANLVSYRYNSLSEMTQSDRQSGARSTYSFDEASRVTAIAHKQSATATNSLLSLAYTRDAVGQITGLTDDLGKTTFSYDAIYRLTGAQAPATAPYPDLTFAYDKAGNRKSVVATPQAAPAPAPQPAPSPAPPAPSPAPAPPAEEASGSGGGASGQQSGDTSPAPSAPTPTTTAYTTNNLNQYTRVGAANYTHDKNGNLTSDGTRTYRWDAENRLTGVTIPGAGEGAPATTVSYAYDDFHRRVKKTVGSATTYFLWSGDRLLAEYAGDGTLQRRYLYGTGFAPAQVQDVAGATTTSYDVHTDHLDTPRLLTNRTGAVVWTARHRAFGRAHVQTDPDADGTSVAFPFRFPGQYEDAETGLYYNWHRYYDPGIGRYLSPDPLGQFATVANHAPWVEPTWPRLAMLVRFPEAAELYDYSTNSPVNVIDPFGTLSATFRFYVGIGFEFKYGYDAQGDFFQFSAGFGIGGGLGVDPNGKFLVQPEDFPCPPPQGSRTGFIGMGWGASARAFGASAGKSYTGGLGIANQPGSSAPGAPKQGAAFTKSTSSTQFAQKTGLSASARVNLVSVGVGGL